LNGEAAEGVEENGDKALTLNETALNEDHNDSESEV